MTPISAGPALQHIEFPNCVRAATSELAPAALSDSAPWLYSALSQLHDLESSGRVVAGVGDLRISELASMRVRTLLSLIQMGPLPVPCLYPISGRGVGMRWDVGKREVEFTIFGDGNTVIAKLEDADLVDDAELTGNTRVDVPSYLEWLVGAR